MLGMQRLAKEKLLLLTRITSPSVAAAASFSSSAQLLSFDDKFISPKSRVPTYHFQKSLPRLPIPELDFTLNKYLETVKPLMTDADFQKTQAVVEDFKKNEGPKLHAQLLAQDKANKHTSYISAPWFEMYLADRSPLPINYNPQITMNDHVDPKRNTQAERAASLIAAALRFQNSLNNEILYPDIFHTKPEKSKTSGFDTFVKFLPQSISFYGAYLFGAYPLDMSQYSRLFSSTRIPKKGADILYSNPSSEHILVMRNGHFYQLYVRDSKGNFLSEGQILGGIKSILSDNAPKASSDAIGILSTENRDVWADYREELYATNKRSLEAVDSAIFCISLDDEDVTDPEKMSRLFLFGDGKNRWFDKSFSLIVTKNGKSAINFEHSWGDGVAVVRFLNEVFDSANASPAPVLSTDFRAPEKLKWELTPKVLKGIEAATQRFNKDTSAMDLKVLTTNVVKRNQLKEFKVSPDGFLQMSFQLAYHKLFGKTVTTYESASTAAFKHGRTEAIRSATQHSAEFTKVFSNPAATVEQKNDALRKAITQHSKISVEAMMGKGVDRHLFALRYIAKNQGSVPAIYQDKAYQILNTNILSTSTLQSPAIVLGGFGPVAKDGFGIGYGMDEENLRFNITSYLPVAPLMEKLHESLKEMTQVLSSVPAKKEK